MASWPRIFSNVCGLLRPQYQTKEQNHFHNVSFYFSSCYCNLKFAVVKIWKSLSFERSKKSSARDVGSCKIFAEIFRGSRCATLKRWQTCCDFTLLTHAMNSSFMSKARLPCFSITGTSRRRTIKFFSRNNAKGKDSYQHRRHRPRRLRQVDHNWPFDLQMRWNRQANNWKVREGGPRGKFRVVVVVDVSLASEKSQTFY